MSYDLEEDLANNGDENEPGMTQGNATNRGECRSCKAEILWIKHKGKDGKEKSHPVNTIAKMMWVEMDFNEWKLVKAYESHFATCPNSESWRKNGRKN